MPSMNDDADAPLAADGDCRLRRRPAVRLDDGRFGIGVPGRGRHAPAASSKGRRQAGGCSTPRRRSSALAHRADAQVIINDRADIARLSGADGVHVGPGRSRAGRGASPCRRGGARRLVDAYTTEQVEAAILQPVSYVAIGPGVRHDGHEVDRLRQPWRRGGPAAPQKRRAGAVCPLVAIGGD